MRVQTHGVPLKRVFSIEIETCSECGGDVRIVASIEDPAVIKKILAHLDNTAITKVDHSPRVIRSRSWSAGRLSNSENRDRSPLNPWMEANNNSESKCQEERMRPRLVGNVF